MNLEVHLTRDVAIIRLKDRRLLFPELEVFSSAVKMQIDRGARNVILNLSDVTYLDSPAHGCLFELFKIARERGGTLKLVGLQPRVEAMASLVGLTKICEVFRDEARALESCAPTSGRETPPRA